jgi:hypothetical protein
MIDKLKQLVADIRANKEECSSSDDWYLYSIEIADQIDAIITPPDYEDAETIARRVAWFDDKSNCSRTDDYEPCKCGACGEAGRTCVFSEEIHGTIRVCNCCDYCYRQCAEGI